MSMPRIDRAGQLLVRLGRFRGDHNIGAVTRRPQRNGEPDPSASACNKKSFSSQAHAHILRLGPILSASADGSSATAPP
jgi:hypothetical protein